SALSQVRHETREKGGIPMSGARLNLVLFAAGICGCAAITPHRGFDRVQQEVSDRSGLRVQWSSGAPDDLAAQQAVAGLVERELSAEAAMQIALLNNHEIQALYEELSIAQAELVRAGLLKNPVFSGEIRFALTGGQPAVDMGIAEDFIELLTIPLRV